MTIGRRILLRLFGRPTGVLGRLGGVIMARLNRDAAARVVDLLELEPGDRVLEIGFGPGVGIEILSQRASVRSIAGIDPSREMIAQATARNVAAIGTGRVELLQATVDQMPFVDREFDKVVSVNSMQVWPDAVAGMREVRRVLKAGGRVALGFTPYAGYSNAAVIGVLAAAGFGEPRVVESLEVSCVIATKP
jgi:ubiquinone/menaquinone biosynthesis C-methylase UbiE